jgi:hypothetical protein
MEIYGAAVADKLDNNRGILRKRYYRQVSFVVIVDHGILFSSADPKGHARRYCCHLASSVVYKLLHVHCIVL